MISPEELTTTALDTSKADGCTVVLTGTSEVNLRWANSTMTTNGHMTTRSFSVISVIGDSVGVVSGNGAELDEVHAVVAASEQAARESGPAQDVAPLVEGDTDDDFGEPAAATEIGVFTRLTSELAEAIQSGRGELLYGFADHRVETTWLASSTGLRRRWVQPTGTIEINAKIADDLTRSAWAGAYTADFTDLDFPGLVAELQRRLDWSKRLLPLPAGRYETILPPSAVADLMLYMVWSMDGRPAHEGRSAFAAPGKGPGATRLGEQLTELPLTLSSDPSASGLQTAPFLVTTASSDSVNVFDNGTPVHRVDWLRNGTINALAYPRAAVQEFGAQFTPPAENLILTGDSAAPTDELVARTDRGLLLTCLWYIREVDPVSLLLTGLTRDGVYLVEGGEVVGQVNNFRFNESPIDLIRRVSEVGATERTLCREWKDWFSRTAMAPLRVPDFNMSSVSQAS
ncbi:MAG: TldD/PmbA family protein [Pseudonocardiales bacterium]|nr:TldD/PmbA family protein [Pseudonocardiales bacterium]